MKKIFILFGVISFILFVYSAVHLGQQFNKGPVIHLGPVVGFAPAKQDPEYDNLTSKFSQRIKDYSDRAEHHQSLYFWMNFLVTGLTAASTLVSAIQSAKKDSTPPPDTKRFAIIVAILAFASTLSNSVSTHFNDLKSEEVTKVTALTTLRDQFFSDYQKATPETKHEVIVQYGVKLG